MEFQITSCNNFFKLKGALEKNNLELFVSEFEDIFEKMDSITISIEDVTSMDRFGVNALATLHNEAIAKNKSLSIIGLGCKDLYNHFKSAKAA